MKTIGQLIFVSLIISIFIPGMSKAQGVDEIFNKFIKRYHTYHGTRLPFYLLIPADHNAKIKYPLVLCLHGSGERGDDPSAVKMNSLATVWATDSNQNKWPCFVLVPQCPVGKRWVNYRVAESYSVDDIPISDELLTVNDMLDSLIAEFSVDTNRLYITGISMGGFGTWDMILRFPDRFAAAVPMSGGGDPSKAEVIKNIPIWDFHGEKDGAVSVKGSREMIAALEKAGRTAIYTNCNNGDCTGLPDSVVARKIKSGATLLYTEYMNGPHQIWDEAYNNPFLLPWVFSQSKTKNNRGR